MEEKTLTTTLIERYAAHLRERERSAATVEKYIRDLNALRLWLGGAPLTKEALLEWRGRLTENHAPASVTPRWPPSMGSLTSWAGRN